MIRQEWADMVNGGTPMNASISAATRTGGQARHLPSSSTRMSNVFMAGPELVRWDVTACGDKGPYRLVIRHAHGTIVEYFHTATDAIDRETELEELLIAARGGRPSRFGAVA